jgi:hypothetical protein
MTPWTMPADAYMIGAVGFDLTTAYRREGVDAILMSVVVHALLQV